MSTFVSTFAGRNCPDCGVRKGEQHAPGCDVARCLLCGGQAISCDCDQDRNWGECVDCWLEEWPGERRAAELGLYSYLDPRRGWVRCGPEHPDATPDLNRLVTACTWDAAARQWVLRKGGTP